MNDRKMLLVIDDEPTNVEIMQEVFGEEYAVKTASSGQEGLDLLKKCSPDLILLDIMMPGLNGYETCRAIRKDPVARQIKVILVSAKSSTRERLEGYEAGADDYITKPFDIHEIRAKVKAFLRLKSAEEVVRIKTDVINLLAHETSTPIHGILGFAELLLAYDATEEERREMVNAIISSAQRLRELHEKALLLARFRSGEKDLETSPVELPGLVRMIADKLKKRYAEGEAEVAIEATGEPVIEGDPRYLAYMIDALLDNAVRVSARDGVVVAISVSAGQARIRITDHGPGIAAERIGELFEEFSVGNVMGHSDGHKLSLAISRAIARRHGGDIDVESAPDRGSTFEIRLPIGMPNPGADETSVTAGQVPPPAA